MARKALVIRQQRMRDAALQEKAAGRTCRFPTRVYNRCNLCGRRHGYLRFFSICRICFREYASNGEIPGVTKSSW